MQLVEIRYQAAVISEREQDCNFALMIDWKWPGCHFNLAAAVERAKAV
ncbi:MAG: hypothetical protein K0U59_01020 [Gammaproteobacteria bacterium]|nr:hypothetical protein [Gammaproteobacteria bacterium]